MLSKFSDQRQAISAAEMSKSIHRVGSPVDLSLKHAGDMKLAKLRLQLRILLQTHATCTQALACCCVHSLAVAIACA